ncbi:MAG: FixH family protein [Paracoccaceae bacterium]|nr:FixH family protein [Paracoccaceae bacterium]
MSTEKPLTGRKVLLIALAAFGIVIGANLAMLFSATGTFPGLVVKNSYVASQQWQARTDAQKALGWQVEIGLENGRLSVTPRDADGALVQGLDMIATIGRPTQAKEDRSVELQLGADGYSAPIALAPGAWRVEIATRSGPAFRIGAALTVREAN